MPVIVANVATNIGVMDRLHLHLVLHNVFCIMEATNLPNILARYSKYMQSGTQWNALCSIANTNMYVRHFIVLYEQLLSL